MKNELEYHGKTLNEMTNNELSQQYVLNKKRIVLNIAFLTIVSGVSLIYYPLTIVIPIGIGIFRVYWINKNNKLIEQEMNKRGINLSK